VLAAGASDWVFERQSAERFAAASPLPLDHLIDCVEHGRQPTATVRDARQSFVAAMAAYRSAREGRPVRLDSK
jgi:predicted dehydrogenase